MCPITVIVNVLFEDIFISSCLQLNYFFHNCAHVHGLAMLLIIYQLLIKGITVHKKFISLLQRYCLLTLVHSYKALVYLALDLCTIIVFVLPTHSLLILIIALHHAQCFLINKRPVATGWLQAICFINVFICTKKVSNFSCKKS